MMTNTYVPFVGGVERSVVTFANEYRARGHRVLVAAPEYEGRPEKEPDVIRYPAIRHFNGSEFSVKLPIPGFGDKAVEDFAPDVIHAHHPFLMGDTALRIAYRENCPLIYTQHTLYEAYTHYVPWHSEGLKRFVIELSTGYANLCDAVLAPTPSISNLLTKRGVRTPVHVVPTGLEAQTYVRESGRDLRKRKGIPAQAFVAGHVGRLAPEKNLTFLSEAMVDFLQAEPKAHFLLVGDGPASGEIHDLFERAQVLHRVHATGTLEGEELLKAYHAMDAFVFASLSETQGMVLMEAMAAGLPVVAVDAFAVRDIVNDGLNGRLLKNPGRQAFAAALEDLLGLPALKKKLSQGARKTAHDYSMARCAEKALTIYSSVLEKKLNRRKSDRSDWARAARRVQAEWDIWKNIGRVSNGGGGSAGGTACPDHAGSDGDPGGNLPRSHPDPGALAGPGHDALHRAPSNPQHGPASHPHDSLAAPHRAGSRTARHRQRLKHGDRSNTRSHAHPGPNAHSRT